MPERWADVYVPHVSPASMSPASRRRCPRALSPGARCDGPTSTSACWPTVLPSGIVALRGRLTHGPRSTRSEEHTSELQSLTNLVCRLLLEKKKKHIKPNPTCRPKP